MLTVSPVDCERFGNDVERWIVDVLCSGTISNGDDKLETNAFPNSDNDFERRTRRVPFASVDVESYTEHEGYTFLLISEGLGTEK